MEYEWIVNGIYVWGHNEIMMGYYPLLSSNMIRHDKTN